LRRNQTGQCPQRRLAEHCQWKDTGPAPSGPVLPASILSPTAHALDPGDAARRAASSTRRFRSARQQTPEQRQPQLARVRHRPVVDEDVRARPIPDDLIEVTQRQRVIGLEARADAEVVAAAGLEVLPRRPRERDGALVVGPVEPRERQRQRERVPAAGAADAGPRQRQAQVGIERGQFLFGRLLGKVDVGPEARFRPVRRFGLAEE